MIYRFLREVVQAKYEEVGKDISNQWHFFSNDISNQWHLSTIHPNTLTGFYLLGSPIRICHASNCQLQKCCTPKMLSSDVGKPAVLNLQLLIQNYRQTMINILLSPRYDFVANVPNKFKRPLAQVFFLKNGPTPASYIVYFRSFQTNIITIFTSIWEKVHPVYGTGIETHNHQNMSLLL